MIPVYKALKSDDTIDVKIALSAQHREMLDQVMDFFEVTADYDLNLMRPGQNLNDLSARILQEMKPVLDAYAPDLVLVHGDTTTSSMGALAAFYNQIKVGHVEAGLRTHNIRSPFPEELNRQLTGRIADFHFAPTEKSHQNLIAEGIAPEKIDVTGNTVIDALLMANEKVSHNYSNDEINKIKDLFEKDTVLITGHRRENFGEGFIRICESILESAQAYPHYNFVYPVHLNPQVQGPVYDLLSHQSNIHLINPLSYPSFIYAMGKAKIILTDSGGVQEEAPSLGKPVLVMRDNTERPEAVTAGTVKLVGTDKAKITTSLARLIEDEAYYNEMAQTENPYGDGKASARILEFIKTHL